MQASQADIAAGHTAGYMDRSLRTVRAIGQSSKTWDEFAKSQFVETDAYSFDYVAHYNKQYGHVSTAAGGDGHPPSGTDQSGQQPTTGSEYPGWTYDQAAGQWVEVGSGGNEHGESPYPGWKFDPAKNEWVESEAAQAEGQSAPPTSGGLPSGPPPGEQLPSHPRLGLPCPRESKLLQSQQNPAPKERR